MENGAMDGIPRLDTHAQRVQWIRVFGEAYELFERGGKRNSVVDEYASGDPSEFFAVVTESFFERSMALKREQPKLYEVLAAYYCVDPATWSAPATVSREALPRAGRRARRPHRK
jgi:Mlc titration factor MtfA (ptsG expression regulator)